MFHILKQCNNIKHYLKLVLWSMLILETVYCYHCYVVVAHAWSTMLCLSAATQDTPVHTCFPQHLRIPSFPSRPAPLNGFIPDLVRLINAVLSLLLLLLLFVLLFHVRKSRFSRPLGD